LDRTEYPWELLALLKGYLESLALGKIEGTVENGAVLVNPELISIGKGTVVESGAYIRGPFVIGENGSVRQGAYVRGHVLAGDEVVIGHTTEAKNTIFLDGAQAGHFAYLGDSVLGNRVNVGAGTKCANLRLDGKNISVNALGKKFDTGLRKFGAIIGDDVQIGCNAVTNPGTVIGQGAVWHPCVNHGGYIPPGGIVKQKNPASVVER
jgi:NDP-sugar pyrophosphorylase family protein